MFAFPVGAEGLTWLLKVAIKLHTNIHCIHFWCDIDCCAVYDAIVTFPFSGDDQKTIRRFGKENATSTCSCDNGTSTYTTECSEERLERIDNTNKSSDVIGIRGTRPPIENGMYDISGRAYVELFDSSQPCNVTLVVQATNAGGKELDRWESKEVHLQRNKPGTRGRLLEVEALVPNKHFKEVPVVTLAVRMKHGFNSTIYLHVIDDRLTLAEYYFHCRGGCGEEAPERKNWKRRCV